MIGDRATGAVGASFGLLEKRGPGTFNASKAAQLGLYPEAANLSGGTWITQCSGTNHTLQLQPKKSLFYCATAKSGAV